MAENALPNPGDVYVVPWPFMRDEEAIEGNKNLRYLCSDAFEEEVTALIGAPQSSLCDGPETPLRVHDAWEWKPGMRREGHQYDIDEGNYEYYCDGLGRTEITIVSTHRPTPKHDYRVFYYQRWLSPDGRVEGKRALKMKTLRKFLKIDKGITPDNWDIEVDEYTVRRAFGTRLIKCDKCGRPKQAKDDEDGWRCGICSIGKRWAPPDESSRHALEGEG